MERRHQFRAGKHTGQDVRGDIRAQDRAAFNVSSRQESSYIQAHMSEGRLVMHEKEHLVALRPYEGAILMETLHYADEIRSPKDLPDLKKAPAVEKDELELAGQLIKIMKKPFAFKEYRDTYQESLMKLVEAKMKGQEEVVELRVPEIKPTKNLMEALRASIKTHERR